jgi:hypothetical protein
MYDLELVAMVHGLKMCIH